MAGYMVPWVQCEHFDECGREEIGHDETTLRQLRSRLNAEGWCKHHTPNRSDHLDDDGNWVRIPIRDYCDTDGCCPYCSSPEALSERATQRETTEGAARHPGGKGQQ